MTLWIRVIVSISNRAGRRTATVSKPGEKQQSEPRSSTAWLVHDVSPVELAELWPWEPPVLWGQQGNAGLTLQIGVQLLPGGALAPEKLEGHKHYLPWPDEDWLQVWTFGNEALISDNKHKSCISAYFEAARVVYLNSIVCLTGWFNMSSFRNISGSLMWLKVTTVTETGIISSITLNICIKQPLDVP